VDQATSSSVFNLYKIFYFIFQNYYFKFYKKGFHLSSNFSNFLFFIAMYFSVFISKLINVKILDFNKCLGLSICMNSFIILSLIKVAQAAPRVDFLGQSNVLKCIRNFYSLLYRKGNSCSENETDNDFFQHCPKLNETSKQNLEKDIWIGFNSRDSY
jgi:hypothetical protein